MRSRDELKGKTAVITGASSGIGKQAAIALGKEGVNLTLASRNEEVLEQVAVRIEKKYDSQVMVQPTDIRREEEVNSMVEKTSDRFGSIDIVINNAGIIRYGDIETFSTEDYRAVMETNIDGMFFTTRAALPHLRESKGNLIFIGSFDSNHPRSFNPIYCASKWWTKGFAHSIGSIVGERDVAVTLINPSEVRTGIQAEDGEIYRDKFDTTEAIDPEEIAELILFVIKQEKSTTLSQVDIYRRDKLSDFF